MSTSRSGTRRRSTSGHKVVFTDELGGGGAATCNEAIGPNRGADGIYDIIGRGDPRKLVFRSYYKIPRYQADTENCVAHNGSLIPVKGNDIMVQAWYQGGVSVWDFTDSRTPKEIALLRAGPADATTGLHDRRLLVGVLLQRLHLLERHREGPRRAEARRPAHRPGRSGSGWASSTCRRSRTTSTDRPRRNPARPRSRRISTDRCHRTRRAQRRRPAGPLAPSRSGSA